MRRPGTGTEIDEVRGGLRAHPSGWLEPAEAAEVLGVSERTFRRWRDRYEAEGADGLYDRRLGRLSARRAPVDRWRGCWSCSTPATGTSRPSTSTRSADHGLLQLAAAELASPWAQAPAPRRGAHRRKRPRRALPGMMLHQDGRATSGSPAMVGPDRHFMDDATSDIYSAFFVAEEGTMSSRSGPRACSARRHYWNTPEAGGRWTRTPRPRSAAPWRSSASS